MISRLEQEKQQIKHEQPMRIALYGFLAFFGIIALFFDGYPIVFMFLLAILALAIYTPIEDAKRLKKAEENDRDSKKYS